MQRHALMSVIEMTCSSVHKQIKIKLKLIVYSNMFAQYYPTRWARLFTAKTFCVSKFLATMASQQQVTLPTRVGYQSPLMPVL